MNKGPIAKTFVSESGKKTKNRKNGKTSSTDIDSNSQKNDSHSNSKKMNHLQKILILPKQKKMPICFEDYKAQNQKENLIKEIKIKMDQTQMIF